MEPIRDIYHGMNPVDAPAYTLGAVAHYLELPDATVRYWAFGRERHAPVILVADPKGRILSFRNLVEIHVLSAVRRQHRVTLPAVRRAVLYLREQFNSSHPLADEKMLTNGTEIFVERFGQLINASDHGQIALEGALRAHLRRVERDNAKDPVRLFPFTSTRQDGPKVVVIDPRVQFGRPCIVGSGVPTAVVIQRFKAGEPLADLATDLGRRPDEIEEAIRYETPLKRAA